MKIGDRVYVHGFVDEIRKDCVIIHNDGGYFGTAKSEIVEAQKTEDIVSVVRCKDCMFYQTDKGGWCLDHDDDVLWLDDSYCSRAVRRKKE